MSANSVCRLHRLPSEVLRGYEKWREIYERRPHWYELREEDLWEELCFCILSSNVPYEMAKSALVQLSHKGLLDIENHERINPTLIASELSRPVYHPARKDGSLRVYRFPRNRAHDIVGAWTYLYQNNSGLGSLLLTKSTPMELRASLASNVPGLGFKEASHFLRDVKYTDKLAVLDTHVVSFLNLFVHSLPPIHSLTPHKYIQLEKLLTGFARDLGLCPAILDMAVWEYMRLG